MCISFIPLHLFYSSGQHLLFSKQETHHENHHLYLLNIQSAIYRLYTVKYVTDISEVILGPRIQRHRQTGLTSCPYENLTLTFIRLLIRLLI